MKTKQLTFIILGIFIIINFSQISCTKESIKTTESDTIFVGKVFQPDNIFGKDAIVQSLFNDSCFGNSTFLGIFSWTNGGQFNKCRAFIEFDLSQIPANTQINSAKLTLYFINSGNYNKHAGENAFTIYRITKEWDENSITWAHQPETNNVDSVTVLKSIDFDQSFIDIDVTKLVQDKINYPTTNHGFMIKLNEEFPYRMVVLGSSDGALKSRRPKLLVYY